MSVKKYGFSIRKGLYAEANQDSTFFHTRDNLKMFNL